ncbi:MAG: dephospho-CoA kinase [Thermodesulfobacteriota bacterium]|nr:dephospho-CoA kinase [Thermodesulfobacteriota bacterium]
MMNVIGLTGGIAAGKSTVSEILSQLGAEIIDADKVGHQIYLPGTEAWKDLINTFGEDILLPEKTINRPILSKIVFADKKALNKLNQIVHPRMYKKIEEEIEIIRARNNNTGVVVLDAAILIEANWLPLVDQVWLVVAEHNVVLERLCKNKGFTQEHAKSRISSQLNDEERRRYADIIIENNRTLSEVREHVKEAWTELTGI